MGITQTPLPGPDAAAIGMAAFLAVYAKGIWALVKHFHVMAHEGMHAITATILGIRVRKVELNLSGTATARPITACPLSAAGVLGSFSFGWISAPVVIGLFVIPIFTRPSVFRS